MHKCKEQDRLNNKLKDSNLFSSYLVVDENNSYNLKLGVLKIAKFDPDFQCAVHDQY